MIEYIARDAARPDAFCIGVSCQDCPFLKSPLYGGCRIDDFIVSIPAADVRPVVRGKWKPIDLTYGRNYYFCSACEETVDMPTAMGIPMFRYCPNCGADMREGC